MLCCYHRESVIDHENEANNIDKSQPERDNERGENVSDTFVTVYLSDVIENDLHTPNSKKQIKIDVAYFSTPVTSEMSSSEDEEEYRESDKTSLRTDLVAKSKNIDYFPTYLLDNQITNVVSKNNNVSKPSRDSSIHRAIFPDFLMDVIDEESISRDEESGNVVRVAKTADVTHGIIKSDGDKQNKREKNTSEVVEGGKYQDEMESNIILNQALSEANFPDFLCNEDDDNDERVSDDNFNNNFAEKEKTAIEHETRNRFNILPEGQQEIKVETIDNPGYPLFLIGDSDQDEMESNIVSNQALSEANFPDILCNDDGDRGDNNDENIKSTANDHDNSRNMNYDSVMVCDIPTSLLDDICIVLKKDSAESEAKITTDSVLFDGEKGQETYNCVVETNDKGFGHDQEHGTSVFFEKDSSNQLSTDIIRFRSNEKIVNSNTSVDKLEYSSNTTGGGHDTSSMEGWSLPPNNGESIESLDDNSFNAEYIVSNATTVEFFSEEYEYKDENLISTEYEKISQRRRSRSCSFNSNLNSPLSTRSDSSKVVLNLKAKLRSLENDLETRKSQHQSRSYNSSKVH